MPISHEDKIIFVHIPKTGGASIEKSLGIFGNDNNGNLEPNFEILYGQTKDKILQHLKIEEIKKLKKKEFETFKLVSFVRNPYDRIISEYLWRMQVYGKRKVEFKEFLNEEVIPIKNNFNRHLKNFYRDEHMIPFLNIHYENQINFIKIDNIIQVNNIGRFENFTDDFIKIFEKKLINYKIHQSKSNYLYYLYKKIFPHFITKFAYRKYYNNETYDLVTKNFKDDLIDLNYNF